ncbi:protein SMAX1-LIKE 3-like [Impatiens glandulifera]|uniref:protein SMAX1-LIKE 3-like n=1 Tax=Impatiens glandulifera TaxID=253017 RepID=UPI001FB17974|nr:protein SMAX1-LIKE 3-like [Impatiens glandulifera]
MRAGANCSVHQSLTSEALGVVKLAITLARRRSHAQVTPLHVANTMLASSSGQLRTACLQSNSHPLQCKALELCFNVALNRLPVLAPHHHRSHNHTTISNSLVAAFKRAQAHQRRGSIESQQQPILAVKIELEQLVISILDDPSVSRVMKEAGFSSTQVKSNLEKSSCNGNNTNLIHNKVRKPKLSNHGDLIALIDSMMLRKSIVIIGEYCHDLVGSLMDKVDRGEVPQDLKEMKFISFPLHSVENRSRDEVEMKLDELRSLVKSCLEKGVALYLGDLKWISDFRILSHNDDSNEVGRLVTSEYCPVEHMAIEVGRLVRAIGDSGNFWLLAIANFHTFMRCKNGNPSLETLWGMHPLTIPQGSLDLSLVTTEREPNVKRNGHDQCIEWISPQGTINDRDEHQLTCCDECSSNFEAEARRLKNSNSATLSTLPTWLQQYKEENQKLNKDSMQVKDLIQKWSSHCRSFHKQPNLSERTINFSSISPSSPISGFSCDRDQNHSSRDIQNGIFSNPNSTTSSDVVVEAHEYIKCFKELNSRNIDILSNALEEKVPWKKDSIPHIVSTILQCRSGMMRRKGRVAKEDGDVNGEIKEETWLLFQGIDLKAKEIIARELARLIFGSQTNLCTIASNNFSSTRVYSSEDLMIGNKRLRDEPSSSYLERFCEAIAMNPHRVFLIEDLDQADYCSQMGIKIAMESGKIKCSSRKETSLSDAIVIFSCETISSRSISSRSRACSSPKKMKLVGDDIEEEEISHCFPLDLNTSCNDDHDSGDDRSFGYIELLEFVDKRIVF